MDLPAFVPEEAQKAEIIVDADRTALEPSSDQASSFYERQSFSLLDKPFTEQFASTVHQHVLDLRIKLDKSIERMMAE